MMEKEKTVMMSDGEIERIAAGKETLRQVPVRTAGGDMFDADSGDGRFWGRFAVHDGEIYAGSVWRELKPPFKEGDAVRVLRRDGSGSGLLLRITSVGLESLGDMTEEETRRAGFFDVGRPEQWDALRGGYAPGSRLVLNNPWVFSVAFKAEGTVKDRKEEKSMIEIGWNGKLADGIKSVKVITSVSERLKEKGEGHETKITVVEFKDGRREKAVCDHRDAFSLETGISLCVAKYLAGGQKELYDAVRRGVALYVKQERRTEKEKENG